MKEKIYTIPVNEAFDTDCECPFCLLERKTDEDILDYILGPSYMEEDIRSETDKIGFCKYHYKKMFQAQNRLGVALMVSTHLKNINKTLQPLLKEENSNKPQGLFSKKNTPFSSLTDFTKELSSSCYACKRAEVRMNSYFTTFFYLWKTEAEFRSKVSSTKGFCLEHMSRIISEGQKRLNAEKFSELIAVISKIQKENLARIDEELDWFIKKFDYRFADEPWKNSKDSLERAILKISSTQL